MTLTPMGLTPFTSNIGDLTRVTPFTHRDNDTFLRILKQIVNYIQEGGTLTTEINNEMQRVIDEFNTGLGLWDERYEALMNALIAQITVLNEAAFPPRVAGTTVYVDPVSGVDTNPGTYALPYKTVSKAIDVAEQGAQNADTAFTIQLASGTYSERVTASAFTPYRLNVVIQGPLIPHPATPIAVFTEGMGVKAAAMKFENPNADFTVKYVKFIGYNGSSSSAGINSAQGRLFTVNVHAEFCFYGVSSIHGEHDAKGGIFDNCGRLNTGDGTGAGIRSLMLNRHSIGTQNQGDLSAGPIFRNCRYGFYAQENSTGHTDWCTFTDNESAIVLRVNSRANVDGSSFARNLSDIVADGGAHAYISSAVTFGTGADKSGDVTRFTAGSNTTTTRAVEGNETAYARQERILTGDYAQQVITGTTATKVVETYNLRAPWWNDTQRISGTPCKRVRVKAAGTLVGSLGTVQMNLRMGGRTAPLTFSANETGDFEYDGVVLFTAPDRQILTVSASRNLADTPRNATNTTAQDMSVDQALSFEVTLGNAGDSVTVEYVELSYG